jgi:hypothetical protein
LSSSSSQGDEAWQKLLADIATVGDYTVPDADNNANNSSSSASSSSSSSSSTLQQQANFLQLQRVKAALFGLASALAHAPAARIFLEHPHALRCALELAAPGSSYNPLYTGSGDASNSSNSSSSNSSQSNNNSSMHRGSSGGAGGNTQTYALRAMCELARHSFGCAAIAQRHAGTCQIKSTIATNNSAIF